MPARPRSANCSPRECPPPVRRPACLLPAHAEPVEFGSPFRAELRGVFAGVVEPCAELDHHTVVSAVLTACRDGPRLPAVPAAQRASEALSVSRTWVELPGCCQADRPLHALVCFTGRSSFPAAWNPRGFSRRRCCTGRSCPRPCRCAASRRPKLALETTSPGYFVRPAGGWAGGDGQYLDRVADRFGALDQRVRGAGRGGGRDSRSRVRAGVRPGGGRRRGARHRGR